MGEALHIVLRMGRFSLRQPLQEWNQLTMVFSGALRLET